MVGVAGKSKACHECKRRRVKCDLGRPGCLRCIKAHLQCSGYGKDIVFVNRTQQEHLVTADQVLSQLKREADQQSSSKSLDGSTVISPQILALLDNPSSTETFRVRAVELLKQTYLPRESNEDLSIKAGLSWIHSIAKLSQESRSLDYALLSFCVSQLYFTGTGLGSVEQGLALANTAMQCLRSDVEDPEKRFQSETLAAIVLLSTGEIFLGPTDDGFRTHAQGISHILRQSHNPNRSTMFQALISRLRTICLLDALTSHKATLLRNIDWHEYVWDAPPLSFADMLSMLGRVPDLLEECEALMSSTSPGLTLVQKAVQLHKCAEALGVIREWMNQFASTLDAAPKQVPSCLDNPADRQFGQKIFPFALEFQSMHFAITHIMCWSTMVQLNDVILRLSVSEQAYDADALNMSVMNGKSRASPLQDSSQTAQEQVFFISRNAIAEADQLARNLCMILEFCLRAEMGTFGIQCMRYPLWTVRQYFSQNPRHERELAWYHGVDEMKPTPGFHTGLTSKLMKFKSWDLSGSLEAGMR